MASPNDPSRAFTIYGTTRCDVPWRTNLSHVSNATRGDITNEEGRTVWNTDDEGPNYGNGTSWFAPAAAADGYEAT